MSNEAPIGKITITIPEQGDIQYEIQGVIPALKMQAVQIQLGHKYHQHMLELSRVNKQRYVKQKKAKEDLLRKQHQEAHAKEQENNAKQTETGGTTKVVGGPGDQKPAGKWTSGGPQAEGATNSGGSK